jgi:hypothetical protein
MFFWDGIFKYGLYRTFINTGTTVDTDIVIDIQTFIIIMKAINRAGHDAVGKTAIYAILGHNCCHNFLFSQGSQI